MHISWHFSICVNIITIVHNSNSWYNCDFTVMLYIKQNTIVNKVLDNRKEPIMHSAEERSSHRFGW